jgi:hypothetical protein
MVRQRDGGSQPSARWRRWAVRIFVACLVLEVVYLIVGNLCIRMGVLEGAINYKPEEDFVSWESGVTVFPGFGTFKGFVYRGQTRGSQMYVHLTKVRARVSLIGFLFKTVDIRGLVARDIDYRYRERIDYPCWTEESGEPFPGTPVNIEYYPEIPGLENPPDPKPEDIYSEGKEPKPWTIKISGARVKGTVRVAYNDVRINGEGSVKGGVTVVLKESSAIERGKVRLVPAAVTWGGKTLTDELKLEADVSVEPFPSNCAEMSEIIHGISGRLAVSGQDSEGFPVNVKALSPLLPGQGMLSIESGVGELGARLDLADGDVVSGSVDLVADDVVLMRQETPLHGDLEVHAKLAEGNLTTRRFVVSGTTFRLDDITKMGSTDKEQTKLEPWFCSLDFEEAVVTFGTPMALDSRVRLTMHDTRPVLVLLRNFTNQLKWLKLTRNVKGLDGTMDLDFGEGFVTVDNLILTGEDVEILGWVHTRNQIKNGRIYARHGARAVGLSFDGDKRKVVTIRPRKWFENQRRPPLTDGEEG